MEDGENRNVPEMLIDITAPVVSAVELAERSRPKWEGLTQS